MLRREVSNRNNFVMENGNNSHAFNFDIYDCCTKDDIANDIEYSSVNRDPWKHFSALKAFMRDRIDWTTGKPMIDIEISHCSSANKNSCEKTGEKIEIGAKDVQDGNIFQIFNDLWKEDGKPMIVKKEQLEDSYVNSKVLNILNHTWE